MNLTFFTTYIMFECMHSLPYGRHTCWYVQSHSKVFSRLKKNLNLVELEITMNLNLPTFSKPFDRREFNEQSVICGYDLEL